MTMFARVVFYPTLGFNVLLEKLSVRQWYSRIDDTVILGALPFKSITKQLVEDEHVRGLVTLNEEYETRYLVNTKEEWARLGVEQVRLATVDHTTPSLELVRTGVDFIEKFKDSGDSVYVHCKAGRTRSTTVVACYLMKSNGWSPEGAVEYIKTKRPHILLRESQWNILYTFHNQLIKET